MDDPRETGRRFAEVVTGLSIADAPPPPGSPLARAVAVTHRAEAEGWTEEQVQRAVSAILRRTF